jgi:glycerophosphoryl diester phosphodiesterase
LPDRRSTQPLEWLTARPIAHRGLHELTASRAENTLSAARAAVAAGFAIEADLQQAECGEPVVFHDQALARMTDRTGSVADYPATRLRQFTVAATNEGIPRLGDLLDLVDGQVPLLLELKATPRGDLSLARRVCEMLRTYGGRVALMSFDPRILMEVARIGPQFPRGIAAGITKDGHWKRVPTSSGFTLRHLLHGFSTKPHFVAYDVNALPALAPLVANAVFARPLLAWTVKTPSQRLAAERWADQIIFEGFTP